MNDYLERLALRAAGLKAGGPAAAADLPPIFGLEAEQPLVATDPLEKEQHTAHPRSLERAARRAEHTSA
ncbi:MAG: hypothetical protein ACRETX_08135, partial [Steroidobacteraceae bacterium]